MSKPRPARRQPAWRQCASRRQTSASQSTHQGQRQKSARTRNESRNGVGQSRSRLRHSSVLPAMSGSAHQFFTRSLRHDRNSATKSQPECNPVSSAPMNTKTFSESFSKWVRNGSSLQRPSYLILFEKSHILASKTGHEPPDSVPSHHSKLRVQQGVARLPRPTVSKNVSSLNDSLTARSYWRPPAQYSLTLLYDLFSIPPEIQ